MSRARIRMGEGLVLLEQGLPGMGFVEEKVEEVWVFSLQVCSPWWPGIYRSRWWRERGGRGEHLPRPVHEASLGVSEYCCCRCRGELCRQGQIGPIGRDQRLTAIGQDQNEMQSTFAMRPLHNVQGSALERMASTDNGDLLGKVLMMGSVSWLPLTTFHTANFYSVSPSESSIGTCCV